MSTTTTRPRPPVSDGGDGGSGAGPGRDPQRPRPTTQPLREPAALTPPMRNRRAITLLLMTLVLPGSAQVTAGNRKLGRIGLRIWFGLLGLAVLLGLTFLFKRSLVIDLFTRSLFLLVVVVALVLLTLVWIVLFLDAWRLGAPSLQAPVAKRWIAAFAALLIVGTTVPMLFAARQVNAGRSLISTVFGGNAKSAVADGRYNVLLLGGDAGSDRVGLRPDSMTLVSIDENTGRTVMFSFPRNMQNVPFPASSPMHKAFPNGFNCGDTCLLNAIYTYASDHKGLYPKSVKNPGAQATMDAISAISGLKVNYYALIDLAGFKQLINAMGGVTIKVNERIPIGGETSPIFGYINPGTHHLDGYHALWFARSRAATSDYDRMARQRCVMTAMLQQMSPEKLLLKFQGIASASSKVIQTSIPEGDLGTFVNLALKAKSQKVTSVQFVPPLIVPMHPNFTKVHNLVATAIDKAEHPKPKTTASASATSASSGASGTGSSSDGEVDAKAVCSAA